MRGRSRGRPVPALVLTVTALAALAVAVPRAASTAFRTVAARPASLPVLDSPTLLPATRTLAGEPTGTVRPSDPSSYLDAVHAGAAWREQARRSPGAGALIAVLDSGVDLGDPALRSRVVRTYDAADPADPSIADSIGHGTFVAGVAAGLTRGADGAATDGDPEVGLLGVKVTGADGAVSIGDEVAGIRWAADHGAAVINLSFGGAVYDPAEARAVAYAQARGALVVAAAGNLPTSAAQYPAAYPGVIAVAATDPATGTRARFSGFGSWVDVAAPGVGIVSTVPSGGSSLFPPGEWATASGTSYATAIVSAEAALLKSADPAMSVSQLRSAVIASAHGYRGQGIGAGQVDFLLGLQHLPPADPPTAVTGYGSGQAMPVRAAAGAPATEFRIDASAWSAPVAVHGGIAAAVLDTVGYPDGRHTLSARSCSAHGSCNPSIVSSPIEVMNPAGAVVWPRDGSAVTGRFTVTAVSPAAGRLRLLVDGRPDGPPIAAPYRFTVNAGTLTDGPHTLQVQLCSASGRRCGGARSVGVEITSTALHPGTPVLAHPDISPNGDGVLDRTPVSFSLPRAQRVQVVVLDSGGRAVSRTDLGRLDRGRHHFDWSGTGAGGAPLPDGTYTVGLVTARGSVRGWSAARGVVDTVAPSIGAPTGARTFYPYPDGYRDGLRVGVRLGGPGRLALTISDGAGRVVATVGGQRPAGRATITWTGLRTDGRPAAFGLYTAVLTVTDAAGNSRSTRPEQIQISPARLHPRTVSVQLRPDDYTASGGSACGGVSVSRSVYPGGVVLHNACPAGALATDGAVSAQYAFTLPSMTRYDSLRLQVEGRAGSASVTVQGSLGTRSGTRTTPEGLSVHPGPPRWQTVTGSPATQAVGPGRQVLAEISLYGSAAGPTSLDLQGVRLLVTGAVLG